MKFIYIIRQSDNLPYGEAYLSYDKALTALHQLLKEKNSGYIEKLKIQYY